MSTSSRLFKAAAVASATLAGVAWAGLRTPMRPQPLSARARPAEKVPVPSDLPQPVARYFALTAGESVPSSQAPRVSGTVRMAVPGMPFPLWMNGRWNASYQPGKSFRRIMELGFFGNVVITGVDEYRDGVGSVTVGDKRDAGPTVDQAADLVMWAESVWMPSILFTTHGLRWIAVDESKARLQVPYGAHGHEITWHFDPATGLLTHMTSFRFKGKNTQWRTAWRVDVLKYSEFEHLKAPSSIAITWEDDGRPWAIFNVLDLIHNADDVTDDEARSAVERLQAT